MSNPCLTPPPAPCVPPTSDARVLSSFTRRYNAAVRNATLPAANHATNGDESLPGHIASYSKAVLQDGKGLVNPTAFAAFKAAIAAGTVTAFEAVPTAVGATRTQNGPMGSYAYTYLGADCSQYGVPVVPVPPQFTSVAYATELVELYWCSLLRDVAFSEMTGNATAQMAANELDGMTAYEGPRDSSGKVTPKLLFRGKLPGEMTGPYLSQFLITATNLGAQAISQMYTTYKAGVDYMTDEVTWEAIQNGMPTGAVNEKDPTPQFLHNGRGLAAFTHVDELYQAYFTAYLAFATLMVPTNPGNPYATLKKQNGFGTFGGPDIASTLAQVAKIALNAVWYQKWVVHLRHRPESGAGIVHYIKKGVVYGASPDPVVFNSQALQASFDKYGTYFLSQPFPEGSPAHPAYPTGHGAVGGACITILKFFYDGDHVLSNPQMPTADGLSLVPWVSQGNDPFGEPGILTVNGELHKLAHNITFGHGLHGGIHWRSDSDSSIALGEAVAISFLEDLVCTYAEPFHIKIRKIDGSTHTFKNV